MPVLGLDLRPPRFQVLEEIAAALGHGVLEEFGQFIPECRLPSLHPGQIGVGQLQGVEEGRELFGEVLPDEIILGAGEAMIGDSFDQEPVRAVAGFLELFLQDFDQRLARQLQCIVPCRRHELPMDTQSDLHPVARR